MFGLLLFGQLLFQKTSSKLSVVFPEVQQVPLRLATLVAPQCLLPARQLFIKVAHLGKQGLPQVDHELSILCPVQDLVHYLALFFCAPLLHAQGLLPSLRNIVWQRALRQQGLELVVLRPVLLGLIALKQVCIVLLLLLLLHILLVILFNFWSS